MRRIALSRLAIVLGCPGSHRDDTVWVPDKSSWSARGGKGFHGAMESYPAQPNWTQIAGEHDLTARLLEKVKNQYAVVLPWIQKHYRPTWQAEAAFAFSPLTGEVRDLAKDDRNTRPGEWYGRFDVIDPTTGLVLDWKSGDRPMPPPKQMPQVWGGVGIVARRFGRTEGRGAVVQVSETALDEKGQAFSRADIELAHERMRAAHLSVTPDAPYTAGDHCTYCPAKKAPCATYTRWKEEQEKAMATPEIPPTIFSSSPVPSAASPGKPSPLTRVVTGRRLEPVRVLIHGAEKVGKSTFANGAPAPIFIGLEGGLSQIGPARFPEPRTFGEVLEYIESLRVEPHSYRTVAIDPINWLEPLVFAVVCEEYGKQNIDEVLGGFQKGQARAVKYWEQLTAALDSLRAARGMHVILAAHTVVRNQKNPEAQDWGSWQPALDKVGAEHMKRWVDAILFARHEEFAKAVDNKVKGRSTGSRIMHSQSNAAFAAGNRYGLPEQMPLSWAEFWTGVEQGHGKLEELTAQARAMATELGPDVLAKCNEYLAAAANDVGKIAEVLNALEAKRQSA